MNGLPKQIAVVGAGLVGLGWAIVFARAGLAVTVFDAMPALRLTLLDRVRRSLADMRASGLIGSAEAVEDIVGRLHPVATLEEAVAPADFVQESVLERADIKHAVCLQIDAVMKAQAVCGSSSSGIPASAFTSDLSKRSRFLINHPVNPPHLIPLVEIVPAPWTDPSVAPWLRSFMESVGQVPITVNHEIEGFVLNRLQGALLNEAWALYEDGAASLADIDRAVKDGLGYRWSFMGPFETIDLNAPGGIADYASRLGSLYHRIALSRAAPRPWSGELVSRVEHERRTVLAERELQSRSLWRDRKLMSFIRHLRASPETAP